MSSIDPRKLVVSGGSKSSARDQEMSDEEDSVEEESNEEGEEETFTVEAVLDYTTWDKWADTTKPQPEGDRYEIRYYVKWLGYDSEENSWEPQENFSNQEACVNFWKECEKSHPEKKRHQAVVNEVEEENKQWKKKAKEKGKGKKTVSKKSVNAKRKRVVKEGSVSSTSTMSKKPRQAPPSSNASTSTSVPSQPSTRRRQRGDLVDQAAINDMSRDTKLLRELRFPTPPQHDADGRLIVSESSEGSSPRLANDERGKRGRSRNHGQRAEEKEGKVVNEKASRPTGFASDSDSMEEDQMIPIPRTIPNRGLAEDVVEEEIRPDPYQVTKPKTAVTGFAGEDSDEDEEEEEPARQAPLPQASTSEHLQPSVKENRILQASGFAKDSSEEADENDRISTNVNTTANSSIVEHATTAQATGFARDSDEEDSGHGEEIDSSKKASQEQRSSNQGFAESDEEEEEGEGEEEQLDVKRSETETEKNKEREGSIRKKEKSKSSEGKSRSGKERLIVRKRESDSRPKPDTSTSKTKKRRTSEPAPLDEKRPTTKRKILQDEDPPAPAQPSVPSQKELLQKLKFGRISKDTNRTAAPPRNSHSNERSPSVLTNSATDQQSTSRGSGHNKKQEEDPFNYGVQRPTSKDGYVPLNHDMLKMKKLPEAIYGNEKPNWPVDLHQDQDRIRWWWRIGGNPLVNFADFDRVMNGREVFVTSPPTQREVGTNKQAAAHEKDYLALQLVLSTLEGVKQDDSLRPAVSAVFVHSSLVAELGRFPGKLSELDRYRDRVDVVFFLYGTGLDKERTLRQFWRPLTAITFTASALLEDSQRLSQLLRVASSGRDAFIGSRNQFPFMLPQYLLRGGVLGSAVDDEGNLTPRSPSERATLRPTIESIFSLLQDGSLSLTALGASLDKPRTDEAVFPCIFDRTPLDPVVWEKLSHCYPPKFCKISVERLQKMVCSFRSQYTNIRRWIVIASQDEIDSLAPAPGIVLTTIANAEEIVSQPIPVIL